jgi:hypothetical protein
MELQHRLVVVGGAWNVAIPVRERRDESDYQGDFRRADNLVCLPAYAFIHQVERRGGIKCISSALCLTFLVRNLSPIPAEKYNVV